MSVNNFDPSREFADINIEVSEPEEIPSNMVEAKHFAYHVTNVEASAPKPTFTELRLSIAYDNHYDKALVGLPCVFVSTTVMGSKPPKGSYYPTSCKDSTTSFHRLCIPFKAFDPYDRIWLASAVGEQRHIVLTKGAESNIIEKKPTIKELRWESNQFFCRVQNDHGSYKYYVNQYYNDEAKYFVNIVLLHNFKIRLNDGMYYQAVRHWIPREDNPERANDLENEKKNFAEHYELKEDSDPIFYADQMQKAQDAWSSGQKAPWFSRQKASWFSWQMYLNEDFDSAWWEFL